MIIAVLTTGLLAGCSPSTTASQKTEEPAQTAQETSPLGVTEQQPIHVDKDNHSVTVLAKVNGKYFTSPTRHALVYKDGNFGDKAVFQSMCDPITFYQGLLEIGAKPGENMKMDTASQTHVEGDILQVSVITPDKTIDLNEAIKDSLGNPIEMRFGGNAEASKEYQTGCLACLDSCPVGIVSNHSYTLGAVEDTKEVEFYGNQQVLPGDGTFVALKFTCIPNTSTSSSSAQSCPNCSECNHQK